MIIKATLATALLASTVGLMAPIALAVGGPDESAAAEHAAQGRGRR
ncbi:hypothetical protein [Kribbella speibonae]|nr:hypothetical protein [Kribbella speibonae]